METECSSAAATEHQLLLEESKCGLLLLLLLLRLQLCREWAGGVSVTKERGTAAVGPHSRTRGGHEHDGDKAVETCDDLGGMPGKLSCLLEHEMTHHFERNQTLQS